MKCHQYVHRISDISVPFLAFFLKDTSSDFIRSLNFRGNKTVFRFSDPKNASSMKSGA